MYSVRCINQTPAIIRVECRLITEAVEVEGSGRRASRAAPALSHSRPSLNYSNGRSVRSRNEPLLSFGSIYGNVEEPSVAADSHTRAGTSVLLLCIPYRNSDRSSPCRPASSREFDPNRTSRNFKSTRKRD